MKPYFTEFGAIAQNELVGVDYHSWRTTPTGDLRTASWVRESTPMGVNARQMPKNWLI